MSYLKQYKLMLKTLSPIFIGSGENLSKKEYLYISQTKEVLFIDVHKLFSLLDSRKLLGEYVNFVMGQQKDLYAWLMSKHFTQNEIRSVRSYSIHAGNAMDTASGFNLTGVQLFVKDAYQQPYIPGSSLKGAVRTAILAAMTEKRDYASRLPDYRAELSRNSGRRNVLKRESEKVEAECLHTLHLKDKYGKEVREDNPVNSVMKGIQISDSAPLPQDCLTLCAKIDICTNGLSKSINMARECIRPGITAEHILTLDTQILSDADIDISVIQKAIARSYQIQNEYFLSKFAGSAAMDKTPSNGCELYLGGGAGFISKSILYPMLKEKGLEITSELMRKQLSRHYHETDIEKGVSPHMLKCTRYGGKTYLMGRCEVSIS